MLSPEWTQAVVGIVSALVGAAGGLVVGVWRVAHIEQDLRKDFSQDIAEATHELAQKLNTLAQQFDETLKGLRQKINDVELETERNFVAKPDFDDFRKEYREDMREIKTRLDRIPRTRQ